MGVLVNGYLEQILVALGEDINAILERGCERANLNRVEREKIWGGQTATKGNNIRVLEVLERSLDLLGSSRLCLNRQMVREIFGVKLGHCCCC